MAPETSTFPTRIFVTSLVWLKPGGSAPLAAFRARAASLFERHDLRIERELVCSAKGQLVGENRHELPQLVQVFSLPSLAAFRAYAADPEYTTLAAQRDVGIERMVATLGRPLPEEPSASSTSAMADRLYGVGFLRFEQGGADGLAEFNRRAIGLFARHGMHVESMFEVTTTLTPVGALLTDFTPERVVVFFLDSPSALKAYATDPEYAALAPVRDRGLRSYDFFLGRVQA